MTQSFIPAEAREKWQALRIREDDLQVLVGKTRNRIGDLERLMRNVSDDSKVAQYAAEIDDLSKSLAQHQQKHRDASVLRVNIDNWLKKLPANAILKLVAPSDVRGKTLDDLVSCVRQTRNEIATLKAEIENTRHAPLPRDEFKRLARQQVADMAARGKPTIKMAGDRLEIGFADPQSFAPSSSRAVLFLAWLDSERLVQRLHDEIDARPEPPLALTVEERRKRLAKLKDRLDGLERFEEDCIEHAATRDQLIERRSDADPAAVLSVTIKTGAERVRLRAAS